MFETTDSTKFQRRLDLRIIWSSVNLADKREHAPEISNFCFCNFLFFATFCK